MFKLRNHNFKDKWKMIKNSPSLWLRVITISVCLCVFLYSAYRLIGIGQEYKVGADEYKNLKKQGKYVYLKKSSINKTSDKDTPLLAVDFNQLKKVNSEVVGWIYFKNSNISYPIVKGTDNSYYLNHTFRKEINSSGSIFMDNVNDSSFKDLHTIIYGHNMKNGTMFGTLNKYYDKEFFKSNPYFWIYTLNGTYRCEIFSAYITKSTSESYNKKFTSKDEYDKFLKNLVNEAMYNTGVTVTKDDLIISLSTCTCTDEDSRLIVNAKLIKVQQ